MPNPRGCVLLCQTEVAHGFDDLNSRISPAIPGQKTHNLMILKNIISNFAQLHVKLYLINHGVKRHRELLSKPVREFVRSHRKEIRIYFLPKCSPELNPDEQVWNEIKNNRICRQTIKTKKELKKKLLSALHSLQKNVERITSFFNLPDTQYIKV